ncbi:hypothetical protein V2W45_1230915, partial [Cenococcum geophilum]
IYLLGNIIYNIFSVQSLSDAGLRAGTLAIINFMPFFLASPLSLVANIIGILLRSYAQLYGSVAIITIVQSIFHFSVILA